MRIYHHIAILLLMGAFGGLSLGLGTIWGGRSVDESIRQTQEAIERELRAAHAEQLAMRDLTRLVDSLRQWLIMGDLVLGSGETYLIPGAREQGSLLRRLVKEIASSGLGSGHKPLLARIDRFVKRHDGRLREAVELTAENRDARLSALLDQFDLESRDLIRAIGLLRKGMEEDRVFDKAAPLQQKLERLRVRKRDLNRWSMVAVGGFLLLILLLWNWSVRTLVRPLERLRASAHASMTDDVPMHVSEDGPAEMRELASMVGKLFGMMESRVQRLRALLPVCSWCRSVRSEEGYWLDIHNYLHTVTGRNLTDGICEKCSEAHFREDGNALGSPEAVSGEAAHSEPPA